MTDWNTAACAEIGTEVFFPEGKGAALKAGYAEAKKVCARCPLRAACLEVALAAEGMAIVKYRSGVWGGMNPTERREIALQREKQPRVHPKTAAIADLRRTGLDRTAIGRRLGIDHRTVRDVLNALEVSA